MALLVKVQKVKNKGLGTKWYGKTQLCYGK